MTSCRLSVDGLTGVTCCLLSVEGLTGGDFLPSEPEPSAWPTRNPPQRTSEGSKYPPVSDTPRDGQAHKTTPPVDAPLPPPGPLANAGPA